MERFLVRKKERQANLLNLNAKHRKCCDSGKKKPGEEKRLMTTGKGSEWELGLVDGGQLAAIPRARSGGQKKKKGEAGKNIPNGPEGGERQLREYAQKTSGGCGGGVSSTHGLRGGRSNSEPCKEKTIRKKRAKQASPAGKSTPRCPAVGGEGGLSVGLGREKKAARGTWSVGSGGLYHLFAAKTGAG